VDFSEAFQRIVRGHWIVLTACVVLGLGVGVAVSGSRQSIYTAKARVALGSTTPQTEAEAAAISSVAEAIATSSSQVRDALDTARVTRDASHVAKNDVAVRSLGTSNVVELAVSDRDPAVAQKVADALSAEVERTWLGIGHGQTPQVVQDLNARLDDLNQKVAALDAQINSVVDPGKGTDPVRTLLARREDLARQAVALETERDRVVSQDTLDVRASIIEHASRPVGADANGQPQTIVLGGLLGLLLGLGLAALLEALRPTLIGSRRVAAGAGTALLGRLECLPTPDAAVPAAVPEIATRIALAASVARVDAIELVAAPDADLTPLANALDGERTAERRAASAARREQAAERAPRPETNGARARRREGAFPSIRVVDRSRLQRGRSVGLVIVSPTRMSASALDEVHDLVTISGWPVLGVVTYEPTQFFHRTGESSNVVPAGVANGADPERSTQ
jgi:uncharacterized protein YoxC